MIGIVSSGRFCREVNLIRDSRRARLHSAVFLNVFNVDFVTFLSLHCDLGEAPQSPELLNADGYM